MADLELADTIAAGLSSANKGDISTPRGRAAWISFVVAVRHDPHGCPGSADECPVCSWVAAECAAFGPQLAADLMGADERAVDVTGLSVGPDDIVVVKVPAGATNEYVEALIPGIRAAADTLGRQVIIIPAELDIYASSSGAYRIFVERSRQTEVEGWTAEHDAEHDTCELSAASVAYIHHAVGQANGICWPEDEPPVPAGWPWHRDWWKPSDDPVRDLEKAGALIAAEIDRLLARVT